MAEVTRLVCIVSVPQEHGFFRGPVGLVRECSFQVATIASPGKKLEGFSAAEKISTSAVGMPPHRRLVRDLLAAARPWKMIRLVRPHIIQADTPKGGL